MRLSTLIAALALLALATACTNVGQQLKVEREGLNATLMSVHGAHLVGALPATQEAKLVPYLKATQASLDAGDKAYIAGDRDTASIYAKAAAAGLQKVAELYGATTRPITPVH